MREAEVVAYVAGVDSVGVGVPHSDVAAACRKSLELHGFAGNPLHPSGHSMRLAIHERPFLTPYATKEIGDGYVLTVEPELHCLGVADFRFEDTMLGRPVMSRYSLEVCPRTGVVYTRAMAESRVKQANVGQMPIQWEVNKYAARTPVTDDRGSYFSHVELGADEDDYDELDYHSRFLIGVWHR
jgi:hypothetical protein